MAESMLDIAGLVKTVVEPLLEYKDELDITVDQGGEDDALFVEIRVNPDDAGKVIGRQGRVIKAIRTLARAAGSRVDTHVEVELID